MKVGTDVETLLPDEPCSGGTPRHAEERIARFASRGRTRMKVGVGTFIGFLTGGGGGGGGGSPNTYVDYSGNTYVDYSGNTYVDWN